MLHEPELVLRAPAADLAALAQASARRFTRVLRLYPFEMATLASMAAALLFLRFQGWRLHLDALLYVFPLPLRLLPQAWLAGVLLQVTYRWLSRRPVLDYLRHLVRPRWWLLWLRLYLALILMHFGYFWLKVSIPLVNPRLWDQTLSRLDTFLHFGFSPSDLAVRWLGGTPVVVWLDVWYYLWFPCLFYTVAFWSTGQDGPLRRRFVLSFTLLWTLGSWTYVSVPALGPVYARPGTFAAVIPSMPYAVDLQDSLWQNYQWILEGRNAGELAWFDPTRGIACMPSLHVAVHFFFFLWAWRRARPLAWPFAVGTVLTFAGSLLTGWHYAVDGYMGLLLAWVCYRIGRWRDQNDPLEDEAFPRYSWTTRPGLDASRAEASS